MPGAQGPLTARLYTPAALVGRTGPAGLLVFFHGGGMVYGDLDSHDALCRVLAEGARVQVLAVDYRRAPEAPFPAGVEDAWAAYRWAVGNATELGADSMRTAVGGDSSGGYLAASVALRAAEAGVACRLQLLVYTVTDLAEESESRRRYGAGFFLTTEFIERARGWTSGSSALPGWCTGF